MITSHKFINDTSSLSKVYLKRITEIMLVMQVLILPIDTNHIYLQVKKEYICIEFRNS